MNEPTRRAALIDMGSNSIKLFIAEAKNDIKILESLKSIIPIGKDSF